MNYKDILAMGEAYKKVAEAGCKTPKKEAMDPVNAKELKGKHKDRKDKDIDNDGDVDKSDEYLHKRRKAVSKAIKGKGTETEVQTQEAVEDMDEGSIKGSGTDRKAVLKKAYRSGEQKTRDFYKGTITPAPKTSDKGIKKAFDKGTGSNDGSSAAKGAARSTSQDTLRGTEHGRSEPSNSGKTHYKTQTHSSKMSSIRNAKKGKLPESIGMDEAKDHGNMNNGSPSGEGLSPSAKKELANKTPMNPATDELATNALNFKTFKAMTKKAAMRSNDNAAGDKKAIASATSVKEGATGMNKRHTVEIDHDHEHDPDAKKHNIQLDLIGSGPSRGAHASGKKKDLQKYLAIHYGGREHAKEVHPEVH